MGMRSVLLPLLVVVLAAAGCGSGTLEDLFSIFPKEAFEGGDGDIPGDGGVPLPFQPKEIDALAGSQGVTGDVRNIVLASNAGLTYALIAAGTDGFHIADVTMPDLINTESYVANIRDGVNGAVIAGAAVHDLTVVDNRFLVCIAVGTGATNAVTVFDLDILLPAVVANPAADVSGALIPAAPGSDIPVPGAAGKGGGISGSTAVFFVATGSGLVAAAIDAATPVWALSPAQPDFGTSAPATITEVLVNGTTALYATGTNTAGDFGLFVLPHPALPIPSTPTFRAIEGNFRTVVDAFVSGPGTYPLDLASNGLSLYVGGVDEVLVYGITNPLGPALLNGVQQTGPDTISVAAEGVTFTAGADNVLAIGSNVVGQAVKTGEVSFPGTFTIRGVAMSTTDAGSFAFCCAGTSGMRVVQLTESQR